MAGRHGEPPSCDLAESIRSFGFHVGRLKTGTPPRLHRDSIDFSGAAARGLFSEERGDALPVPFSFATTRRLSNRVSCWLLHTNARVRELVREYIGLSPLFNGQIRGIGPRYCPSLEDKVMKFPDRERHQLYLEPEGVDVDEIYVNGSIEHRLPHSLNISFAYVEGESLLMGINDVAVSSGSACTSASLEPSYVLKALGAGDDLAHSSIRFGLGRFTTEEEVDYVIDKLTTVVRRLREMSPLYELAKEGVDLSTMQWEVH